MAHVFYLATMTTSSLPRFAGIPPRITGFPSGNFSVVLMNGLLFCLTLIVIESWLPDAVSLIL
jgi:hypothetical protein